MVTLRPEPAPGHAARVGATLLGRMVLVRGAAAPRIAAAPARGPRRGDSPSRGGRGRPLQQCGGARRAEARSERLVPQRPGGRRHLGPARPAAPRGRGRHSSPAPSTITQPHRPLPIGLPPPPRTRHPDPGSAVPHDGDPSGSPEALPPRPHAPAPSLTHLASTGTWAIPGLGPR